MTRLKHVSGLAAAAFLLLAGAAAQNVKFKSLDGKVLGNGDVPLPSALIYLQDSRSNNIRTFIATQDGSYRFGQIAPDVDYLTSEHLISTPFLTPFEVQAVLPLDLKRLRRVVAEKNLGPLEIKLRGVDLSPEKLRDQLRPGGSRPATLILAGGSGPARAILARRLAGVS